MERLRPTLSTTLQRSSRAAVRWRPITACHLHISNRNAAIPVPHPTIIAQPPPPPVTAELPQDDRVARKRKQAEMLQKGQALRAKSSRPSNVLQKRFWKQVHVKETPDGLQVHLDSRPVRTASKEALLIPHEKHPLAMAIALEWDHLISAQQALKQHYVPLTSLTSRALDIQKADGAGITRVRDDIVRVMMRYLHTDSLLCWVSEKQSDELVKNKRGETLRELQIRTAQPITGYLTTQVWPGLEIQAVLAENSIVPAEQPEMTQHVIRGWVSGLPAFELAALERAVLASKSLLVAARLIVEWSQGYADVRGSRDSAVRFGIEEAVEACSLEVRWQTEIWGEVEDTHDVEKEDLRRQLGSVIVLISGGS